jgi:HemY protein
MKVNGSSARGWIETARAAMAAGLWGEARSFLRRASEIEESAALFKLYSELEDRTGGDRDSVRDWLLKASSAPQAKVWVCLQSGLIYADWSPVAEPHGSFNTIVWDHAGKTGAAILLTNRPSMADALIEAPAA